MVHLGAIFNAKGEDVTELVRSGQYELGENANSYLKRLFSSQNNSQIANRDDVKLRMLDAS